MKTLLLRLFLLFITAGIAQVPQGVSYQAVALNADGSRLANSAVGVKISIMDNSIDGPVIYSETHNKTTNAQGIYNLNIGMGSPATGAFPTIAWGTNSKFLKVEVDPAGGTNYTTAGTNQIMSAPYALYAQNALTAQNALNVSSENIIGTIETESGALGVLTSTTAYAFNPDATGSLWSSRSLSGTPIAITSSVKNVGVLTTSSAYAYEYGATGTPWKTQTLEGTAVKIVGSKGLFGVLTSTYAYAFNPDATGTAWSPRSLSGTVIDIVTSNGIIGVLTTTNAYAFNPNATGSNWSSLNLTGTGLSIKAGGGKIVVYTTSTAYAYVTGSTGSPWKSQSLNGTPVDSTN